MKRLEEARESWYTGVAFLLKLKDTVLTTDLTTEMRAACAKAGVPPFEDAPA